METGPCERIMRTMASLCAKIAAERERPGESVQGAACVTLRSMSQALTA